MHPKTPRSFPLIGLALLPSLLAGQTLPLPPRPASAPSGSAVAREISTMSLAARETEALSQILSGNVPDFIRRLCLVQITNVFDGQTNVVVLHATPDYLAVGSDDDYFLLPLSPATAQRIADALSCALPTRRIVDAIYAAAEVKLEPRPVAPSPAMTTVAVFSNHNAIVRAQRADYLSQRPLGALVAGHKKDVVVSSRLGSTPGKVAIYGWHQTNGTPIQPLYLGHSATWVDYSQCTRLIQQACLLDGKPTTVARILGDPVRARVLSDEGPIPDPRYPTNFVIAAGPPTVLPDHFIGFHPSPEFNEEIASFTFSPEVQIHLNAPARLTPAHGQKLQLIVYALPNGNTIEQTVGKTIGPGDDWHYNIQHIGAQTRFLRSRVPEPPIVVAYLANDLKSWPAWRKKHGDQLIPQILEAVKGPFRGWEVETVLTGHSGGGSLTFGYFNSVSNIPDSITRIAFLDSNYAYDRALGHAEKLVRWIRSSERHALYVFAYDDANALLDGKPFVSAAGGTWGRSHAMHQDLSQVFAFSSRNDSEFQRYSAVEGRVRFLLKENPRREIFHTVQVERNGFIHAMLLGTPQEEEGYRYFGERVYTQWIARKAEQPTTLPSPTR